MDAQGRAQGRSWQLGEYGHGRRGPHARAGRRGGHVEQGIGHQQGRRGHRGEAVPGVAAAQQDAGRQQARRLHGVQADPGDRPVKGLRAGRQAHREIAHPGQQEQAGSGQADGQQPPESSRVRGGRRGQVRSGWQQGNHVFSPLQDLRSQDQFQPSDRGGHGQ
jgi:hypothetical protein